MCKKKGVTFWRREGGTQCIKEIRGGREENLCSTLQALIGNSRSQVGLSTAAGTDEQEPSLRIGPELNARLKGFLHTGNSRVERFEGAVAQRIKIRR